MDKGSRAIDLVVLAGAMAIVAVAMLMTPTYDVVSVFGFDVPAVCGWRALTGHGCPGCGLTRSFAFMAEGAFVSAARVHFAGPPLFALVASQVPYRLAKLVWSMRSAPDA